VVSCVDTRDLYLHGLVDGKVIYLEAPFFAKLVCYTISHGGVESYARFEKENIYGVFEANVNDYIDYNAF